MFLGAYIPASDDLYSYAGNAGFPTGWNAAHDLYQYRSQLQWLGVAKRKVAPDAEANYFGSGQVLTPRVIPGGTPAAQLPNYFIYIYPQMSFVAPTLAMGAIHFWYGSQVARVKPVAHDVWSVPPIRFLLEDGTLVSRANADFIGPYNQTAGPVQIAGSDMGFFDYTGASPMTGASMPFLKIATHPDPLDCWMIDRQGRAFAVSLMPKDAYAGHPQHAAYQPRWTCQREVSLATGDSGALVIAIVDGIVHLVAQVYSPEDSAGPPATGNVRSCANGTLPDVAYFESIGSTLTVDSRRIDYPIATETVAQQILADLQALV